MNTEPLRLTEVFYARRSYTHLFDDYINFDLFIDSTLPNGHLVVFAKERDRMFIVEVDEVKPSHTSS
jgi:hypothetical protein